MPTLKKPETWSDPDLPYGLTPTSPTKLGLTPTSPKKPETWSDPDLPSKPGLDPDLPYETWSDPDLVSTYTAVRGLPEYELRQWGGDRRDGDLAVLGVGVLQRDV